ncbi:MAG: PaaI family thioesterase [Steroidobacteraceae bacterium]
METLYPPGSGVAPPEVLKSVSGLEFMQRLLAGAIPPPPIAITLGFAVASVERGKVVCRGAPGAGALNPMGIIHGGYAATLLDTCMGCAVMTGLDAGTGYTTLELKVSYVRPLDARSRELRATGRTLQVGRRAAFAEGEIRDAADRLIAHGTTTCLVFPL